MSSTSQGILLAGWLALCGCTASPPHPEIAKAEPVPSKARSAGEAIAEARCAREVACNNVGIDRRYVSLEDCLTRVWTSWQGDLVESECESGVDEAQLDTCLAEIRVLECNVQLESLERLPACATSQLCIDEE